MIYTVVVWVICAACIVWEAIQEAGEGSPPPAREIGK
jgi:hypothetical protein